MCAKQFLDFMKEGGYQLEVEQLEHEKYYKKCLEDEQRSLKEYPGLRELRFSMYIFTKN